jgi:hypothetical protein
MFDFQDLFQWDRFSVPYASDTTGRIRFGGSLQIGGGAGGSDV